MLEHYSKIKDVFMKPYRLKGKSYSDVIYTLDLENNNLFYIGGKWRSFDKSIDDYSNIPKHANPYIFMFSIENKNYYCTTLEQFEEVLEKLANPEITKIFYVFNLSHEFQFLRDMLDKYTIVDMIARKERKPIAFTIEEFNIQFRCSYMLTNMSLAMASKTYTNVEKKKGDLDYNVIRSPLSVPALLANEKEAGYCEYDLICNYEILRHFRREYHHVKNIPYTSTGTVRKAFLKACPRWWVKKCQALTPTLEEYKLLQKIKQGGYTHANAVYTEEVLENVHSFDKASDYPYQLLAEKYPLEHFRMIYPENADMFPNESYAKIYHLRLYGVRSKYFNHYISYSKIEFENGAVLDNGKIAIADYIDLYCTDCDRECIEECYRIDKIEVVDMWVAKKDYLPAFIIEFILDLYEQKTVLKQYKDDYEKKLYSGYKAKLNGVFGMFLTDTIKSTICYSAGDWNTPERDDEIIKQKLEEQKHSQRNAFIFSVGCWVTAYARREIFLEAILKTDHDEVYSDTDSVKLRNVEKYLDLFKHLNGVCDEKLKAMCEARGIDFERTRPKDREGEKHPLGYFELETEGDKIYTEFITLGAKKYCYRQCGKLEIVVAGLGKGSKEDGFSTDILKDDIRNFHKAQSWGYDDAHKLAHTYIDEQTPIVYTDYLGNKYQSTQKRGVVLMATTYNMSITFDYETLIEDLQELDYQRSNFIEINEKLVQTRRKVAEQKKLVRRRTKKVSRETFRKEGTK